MVDREDSPDKELTQVKQESAIQAVVAAQRQLTQDQGDVDHEDDILRRRGDPRTLVRRPSYRKILTELGGHQNMINEDRDQEGEDSGNSDELGSEERLGGSLEDRLGGEQGGDRQSYSSHLHPSLRVVPTGSLLGHPGGVPGVDHMGLHTPSQIQYSTHNSENGGGYYGNIGTNVDESTRSVRKREIRLLKNREAARECRRKKKEYIKCLENRVAVLENQNKALIEELKNLKELYAGGKM